MPVERRGQVIAVGSGQPAMAMSGPAFRALIGKFISFYTEQLFDPHWGGRIAFPTLRNAVGWDGVVWSRQGGGAGGVVAVSRLDRRRATGLPAGCKPTIADIPARKWWDAEFCKKYAADSIISDPRPEANPAIFPLPATTTRSARSSAASKRCGYRLRCSSAIGSSDLPTRYTRPAGASLRDPVRQSIGGRAG